MCSAGLATARRTKRSRGPRASASGQACGEPNGEAQFLGYRFDPKREIRDGEAGEELGGPHTAHGAVVRSRRDAMLDKARTARLARVGAGHSGVPVEIRAGVRGAAPT